MQLDLSDVDAELLREVLDSVVRDLSPEIADTDNPAYRRELKERRDRLRTMLDFLGGPLGAQLQCQGALIRGGSEANPRSGHAAFWR